MTTAFLSGSRTISRLNHLIRNRLQDIIDHNLRTLIGDANGADKAMQSHLFEQKYTNVLIFCAGDRCRNNIGSWPIESIHAPNCTGRALHTQRDAAMSARADFGVVLWDGSSKGSLNNIFELLKRNKRSEVYFAPRKTFIDIATPADAKTLLQSCAPKASRSPYASNHQRHHLQNPSSAAQRAFSL